ncbi:uncharacterized protein LOC105429624 [Pogonomyrmex barbatus]|uniref:Uncharacterized protein LOC105429624 n=1 Tax=Pogonomyrmex barbatus TaxID=144034 RepID=A0A6I9WNB4_9HYME|nr:uncharacterized protein LOC105429624 [Pogonomyrmex barbatus]
MSDLVSFSDHRYIRWQFGRFEPRKFNTFVRKGWNPDKVDPDKFKEYFRCADVLCDPTSLANDYSHSLIQLLSRVCDLSMPRSRQVHIRRTYWWNEEIAELCKLCIQTRRKLTRDRRRKDRNPQQYEDLRLQYSQRSRNMRNAISRSQKLAWSELLEEINSNPWGRPYLVIMKKIRGLEYNVPLDYLSFAKISEVVRLLFPTRMAIKWNKDALGVLDETIPAVLEDEVKTAIKKSCSRKAAPGLDGLLDGLQSRLSHQQYGFRSGRSMNDAIIRMQRIIRNHTSKGEYCLAIGLDIHNAFNFLAWRQIIKALKDKQVPLYIIRVLMDYLSDRHILVIKKSGRYTSHLMTCGVPQSSVLGPLLWNITYDSVLSVGMPYDSYALCFADDTLIIVSSRNFNLLTFKANLICDLVISKIKSLELEVAPSKTEAVLFCPDSIKDKSLTFLVDGVSIQSTDRMKYLGIVIDNRWKFVHHFEMVSGKAERVLSRPLDAQPARS